MKWFWTPEEDAELARLYHLGESDRDIAERLGRTCWAVVSRRRRFELFDSNIARAAKRRFGEVAPRSLGEILEDVSARTKVHRREIRGTCRVKHIAHARQRFMFEAYATGRYSYPKIGGFLNVHHTSVMHGVRRHEERTGDRVHNASTSFSQKVATLSRAESAKQSTVSA